MERRPVSQIYRSPRIAIPSWGETSHGGERERSCSDAAIMASAKPCAWLGSEPAVLLLTDPYRVERFGAALTTAAGAHVARARWRAWRRSRLCYWRQQKRLYGSVPALHVGAQLQG